MKFTVVNLGHDFKGRIDDYSQARNSFLEKNDWTLFIDDDEEATQMLLSYLDNLTPRYAYYKIRRIELMNGKYHEPINPSFLPLLVSSKVRFSGRIHEEIDSKEPFGIIDFPIIHNHSYNWKYSSGWREKRVYRIVRLVRRLKLVLATGISDILAKQ